MEGNVMKQILLGSVLVALSLFMVSAFWANAQEKTRSPYLLPTERVTAMKEMMMTMQPDTLEAGIERGEKLFNDPTLGDNTTRKSCATCHKDGGTVGGASEMEWKGKKMKVNIPTLIGAAAHFPKPMGPMKALVDLAGMNNMCIMTFLKGDPLDKNSQQSVDLVTYVTSLSTGKKVNPGADKIVLKPEPGAM
jgi:cytochrome c